MEINILGYGLMAKQIAGLFYIGGYEISIWDYNEINEEQIYKQIKLLKKYIKCNKEGTIIFIDKLEELKDNLTIESVIEDIQVKKDIYNILKNRITKGYFTNSSSYAPLEIGERVGALHFLNPITLKLVEIYIENQPMTNQLNDILGFLKLMDFKIIEVHCNRGYIVNNILFHEISAALRLIEKFDYNVKSVASVYKELYGGRDIFNIIDLIGTDNVYRILLNLKEQDKNLYLPRCLKDAIDRNILGIKNRTSIRQVLK